ncbi:MAG: response regulator transcription factor [Elusimicrobia bacterium]|nr:response regulator transcription factor [Elusimicrobiota bacterium]MDE2237121.1 response regulator transcription factor [Elusimicrobiota bacterium]MDE2426883.1 response regulator transcription factor [Elusimicrobiota bacterium]
MPKVLIVEDEADIRELVCGVLKEKGYEVMLAPNGAEGLRLYAEGSPDLVLLDLHLPDMTGFEICRSIRLKGPRPGTPVLICTVRSEIAPVAEGLACGADDYVLKPFQVSDLLERIKAALEAPHR